MTPANKTKKKTSKPVPPASRTTANGNPIQPGRIGRVMIGGHFLPAVQAELKILAIREGKTLGEILREAISDLLTKRGLPTVEQLEAK
jgi:hypothetical protein